MYIRSDTHQPDLDEFSDLGLNDFLVAQRQVARQKLERLQLTPHQGSLFSRGVQPHWEQRKPYNAVLEASMGYAASCSVVVMDEVASINEKTEEKMEEIEEEVRFVRVLIFIFILFALIASLLAMFSKPHSHYSLFTFTFRYSRPLSTASSCSSTPYLLSLSFLTTSAILPRTRANSCIEKIRTTVC